MVSILVTPQSFSGGASLTADKTDIARARYMLPLNMFIYIRIVLGCIVTISTGPCSIFFPHFGVHKIYMVYKI